MKFICPLFLFLVLSGCSHDDKPVVSDPKTGVFQLVIDNVVVSGVAHKPEMVDAERSKVEAAIKLAE